MSTMSQPKTRHPLISLVAYFGALFMLFVLSSVVFAGGQSLGDVAGNVTDTMTNVGKLITAVSYVAGVGFALMGMLKLKAHKDQPTQVPLSQPMVLLVIAAGLVFLPSLIKSAGSTIWGNTGGTTATSKGEGVEGMGG